MVGIPLDGKTHNGVVYRLKAPPQSARYPYLIVSDNLDGPADLVAIKDFRKIKEKLKKIKKRKGLELTLSPVRKMNAIGAGRWFDDVRDLYSFCHSSECQFILSSGASLIQEMVSGPSFDAVLRNCDINPHSHWREMNNWLESKISSRVRV